VCALIGLGTPVSMPERGYDFSFLSECRKPLLLVHGERDEFGDVERLRTLAQTLPPEAHVCVRIIPNAGHFFDDQLDEMSRVIKSWTEERIGERVE
jgi:alpha/beta superfamily hydrolase